MNGHRVGGLLAIACGLAAVVTVGESVHGQAGAKPLPPRLDAYVTKHVKLTPAQRSQLLAGQPVTQFLDADPSREVAVFGAVWVKAPAARYVAALKDIERFESGGGFLVTKKISTPPVLADFAALKLPPDDIADLRRCKVGKCALKLSEPSLQRVQREIDWSKPDHGAKAEALAKQLALGYVTGYLAGGNAKLAVYRDGSRPTFVAQEFTSMIDRLPSLTDYLPAVRRALLEYPNGQQPGAESFLYWQEAKFGLKPTIRINHVTIAPETDGTTAITSKMLYASHYFWSALELRVLVPDPARGEGFWYISTNRSRSDGLSGFVGSLIRGKVRSEADKAMLAALRITKTRMEQSK